MICCAKHTFTDLVFQMHYAVACNRQRLSYDVSMWSGAEDNEMFYAVLCMIVVHTDMHTGVSSSQICI